MLFIKKVLLKIISFGVYPKMEENKKIAIQISSFDAIASLITFVFYFIYGINTHNALLNSSHLVAAALTLFGIYLIKERKYDSGRILIHFVGLVEIFLSLDAIGPNSGFEFYYFAPLIVPFITFTPEELLKSIFLSACGFGVFIFQQIIGPEQFFPLHEIAPSERVVTIGILFIYIIGIFIISRWQMNVAQRKIRSQQSELIHISNIAALGEMSGGIAHEINNPLQILSTQISSLKKQLKEVENLPPKASSTLEQMDGIILRISKLVKGLKNLSRNVATDPQTIFPISDAIDDMLAVSGEKLKHLHINLTIKGDVKTRIQGHTVQLAQVFINLVNNSIDAIQDLDRKWLTIEIIKENQKILITFTDSGPGIPKEVVQKIMHPFFTTKDPGKGTGLGLSISNSMINKVGGKFYYNSNSPFTSFIIELPDIS